jgi:DNA (cytosine-5)-methyltransferase 1
VGAAVKILDLFSGIGGFSLGLERAGMTTAAFCEIEPFCRAVLAKHWPGVPCYDDVRTLTGERLAADGISVDVICGGFPCQDISVAGAGAGLAGERSGLWFEYLRLIGETRPRWVIIENVSALRHRGMDEVLRGIAALRYDAEWHCIPASAVGAHHRRDRLWIVAYPNRSREHEQASARNEGRMGLAVGSCNVADAGGCGYEDKRHAQLAGYPTPIGSGAADQLINGRFQQWWSVEPDVGRVAHGVPARVDRLRALGNAVVPQIPELIGRAIMQAELCHAA